MLLGNFMMNAQKNAFFLLFDNFLWDLEYRFFEAYHLLSPSVVSRQHSIISFKIKIKI